MGSLGFGVLFSTFIILLGVPVGYMILEDFKDLTARVLGRGGEGGMPLSAPFS